MEYEKIRKLIEDMGNSNLTSINIDFPDGTKICMEKEKNIVENCSEKQNEKKSDTSNEIQENIIKSPMVGTFYIKPSPTDKPYVCIGEKVKKGQILCIIEAMKLMNEIESEYDGVIKDILVKDGEPVEYGKPLFIIE